MGRQSKFWVSGVFSGRALCLLSCLFAMTSVAQHEPSDQVVTLKLPQDVADAIANNIQDDGRLAYIRGQELADKAGDNYQPLAAAPLLRRAAEHGHREAQYELALLYGSGDLSSDSADTASLYSKWLKSAALQGHTEAQYLLAKHYQGIGADSAQAFHWMVQAAKGGHVDAVRQTAETFMQGRDRGAPVDKSPETAFYWYGKLADLGEPSGYFWQGVFYSGKLLGRPDKTKARALFLEGAKRGDAQSQYRLGHLYREGDGVAKNLSEARTWYAKVLNNGGAGTSAKDRASMWIEWIDARQKQPADQQEKRIAQQNRTAEETGELIGAVLKTIIEMNQEPASNPTQNNPSVTTAQVQPNCFEVLEREYFVCKDVPDFNKNWNWECHRESRVPIGNGKVRIVKGKDDSRFGQCRAPSRGIGGYAIRYCDPQTGIESDDFKKLAKKVCR